MRPFPPIEALRDGAKYARRSLEAGKMLLASPFSTEARESQLRLLFVSAGTILVGTGVLCIDAVHMGGADLKIVADQLVGLVWAMMATCVYCLVAFMAFCLGDIKVHEVVNAAASFEVRTILSELSREYAEVLGRRAATMLAEQGSDPQAQGAGTPAGAPPQNRAEILTDNINLLSEMLERGKALRSVRMSVEVLLPITVAIFALAICVQVIMRH